MGIEVNVFPPGAGATLLACAAVNAAFRYPGRTVAFCVLVAAAFASALLV